MFSALTNLAGMGQASSGGGFPMSASSGVSGDDGGRFGDFNYRTNASDSNKELVLVGAIVLVAFLAMKKK